MSIHAWLTAANPHLGKYADAIVEYGYDDTAVLIGTDLCDLEEALEDLKVKKPHRALIRRAFGKLTESARSS